MVVACQFITFCLKNNLELLKPIKFLKETFVLMLYTVVIILHCDSYY